MKFLRIILVLNLVISGIPSIHYGRFWKRNNEWVLNLVISGIPSILLKEVLRMSFKVVVF